jgi:23S rRNA pseudouridine1911/1915/1917 synthase
MRDAAASSPPAAHQVVVPEALHGVRLDKAVVVLVPELSRARVKRAIELGAVRVNGRRMRKGGNVTTGDVVQVDVSQVAEAAPLPQPDAPLRLVLRRSDVIVVDKPAGQPTAPLRPAETGTLVNALLGHFPELVPRSPDEFIGHSIRDPGVVHRLDTETSGAIVVALTKDAFDELRSALKDGHLEKTYLLVCAEQGLPESGAIEFPIANHPKDQRRVFACVHPLDVMRYQPRPARTDYRVVRRAGIWALVEARADKALRHQLRAHFAAIGHALAGDELYGGSVIRALGRHALHAATVSYAGGPMVAAFEAMVPLPKEIVTLLDAAQQAGPEATP